MLHYSTMDTPAGPFSAVVDDDGAVMASGFTEDPSRLIRIIHTDLMTEHRPMDDLGDVTRAVRSYMDGELTAIDTVPVRQKIGGNFIHYAWRVMRDIKAGEPVTYTAFAELSGRPLAVRGAASACAKNAAALFVPCHRVLRRDGSLGGYRWGVPTKQWLLDHEKRAR